MMNIRVALLVAGLLFGVGNLALAKEITFKMTDVPGYWFDTGVTIAGTRSLAILAPGDLVKFKQFVESRHTVTSLIWPSTAQPSELIDQDSANVNNHHLTVTTPGLHVYVCKLHPYMLGAVIVDDPNTVGLDIGDQLTLLGTAGGQITFPSLSNLGLRLLRAFFVVTSPSNWKDYTKVGTQYRPTYPAVPVRVTGGTVVPDLNAALQGAFDGETIPAQQKPGVKGVGEVWVDTQYELTTGKGPSFPGTMSVVEVDAMSAADNWKVTRKIALPAQKMNNGHNMWASHDQNQIYNTEWHGKSLFVLNRATGELLQEIEVGHDPAHVMTRVDTGQVHVTLNGEDSVAELNRAPSGLLTFNRNISMQDPNNPTKPTQPHAHWIGFDGQTMVTPNANTNDSTLYDFGDDQVVAKNPTGVLPIATGLMPDSSKYYVANYLGHTISVMSASGAKIKDINLLANYDPIGGSVSGNGAIGGLPIQTPVSPDGKVVITGNTLTATITIVDTATDTLVKSIPCDPGCHGVNYGAKKGGGYYAYVTSKFANRLIVLDYDPHNNGNFSQAKVAGWVVLADNSAPADDTITGNKGMGGQGVFPVPNVYNGWVQQLPSEWKDKLTTKQKNPF